MVYGDVFVMFVNCLFGLVVTPEKEAVSFWKVVFVFVF